MSNDLNEWQNKIKNAQNLLNEILSTDEYAQIDEIKKRTAGTFSPANSNYWKIIQLKISYIIEEINKTKEFLNILNELRPYVESELKKEKYSGQSITDLLNSDDERISSR